MCERESAYDKSETIVRSGLMSGTYADVYDKRNKDKFRITQLKLFSKR